MKSAGTILLRGVSWTIGSYAVTIILRFGTNIVLARLLAPEVFGIMVIVNSVKLGIELVSDVGIGQSIIHNKDGLQPTFHNTAWTIQAARGVLLAAACFFLAIPLADFYGIPRGALQVIALTMISTGLTSTAVFRLEKELAVIRRNLFESVIDVVSSLTYIVLAFLNPTVWSLVIGGVLSSIFRAIGSYLLPNSKQRFAFSSAFAWQIVGFGKWIFIASIVNFSSSNVDRLYLGKVAPLAVLGVYGMARAIADLPVGLSTRLGYLILFPLISSSKEAPRGSLRSELAGVRLQLLLVAAFGLSLVAAFSDQIIKLIYDARYHEAAWMLPILLLGVWGAILSNINEATLLGFGRPNYGAGANSIKLAYLCVGLPVSFYFAGIFGAVLLVSSAELCRYGLIAVGQARETFSFRKQDFFTSLALGAMFAIWVYLRWIFGLGTPFDDLPMLAVR